MKKAPRLRTMPKSGGQKPVRDEVVRKEHGKAEIGTKIRRKTVAENKCKQLILR